MRFYRDIVKNFFDRFFALVLLVVLLPLWVVIAFLIYLDFRESPFFKQFRIGFRCRKFGILKFKKMREVYRDGKLLPEEQRLTKLGRILRRFSLDEIPQLINIVKGDMSFIGPRPLLARYLPYYSPLERRRHLVRPGLTGLAQVNGRVTVDWTHRFEFDLAYVENLSFFLDLKIIFLTVKAVIDSAVRPIDNPLKVIPRFDEYRSFIRLPDKNDDLQQVEQMVLAHCPNLDSEFVRQVLGRDYFGKVDFDTFILIDDFQGKYNSFAIYRFDQQAIEQLCVYVDTKVWKQDEMIKKIESLAGLYARHFQIIKSKNLPSC